MMSVATEHKYEIGLKKRSIYKLMELKMTSTKTKT